MQLLGERNSRIIVAELSAGGRVLASQRDAVVNVEDAVGSTRRPDGGGSLDAVLLGVDLAVEQGAAAVERGAGCLLWKSAGVLDFGRGSDGGRGLGSGTRVG
jgi:hypothetical protein